MKKTLMLLLIFLTTLRFMIAATIPTGLSTSTPANFTCYSFTCGSGAFSDGGATITEKGICWSINTNPTIADTRSYTTSNPNPNAFTMTGSALLGGVTFHIRTYAKNSVGVGYGPDVQFSPSITLPSNLTTLSATNITCASFVTGSNVFSAGPIIGTIIEKGVAYGLNANPLYTNGKEIYQESYAPCGDGSFSVTVDNNIQPNTTYHFRSYAINQMGVSYGPDGQVTTTPSIPYGLVIRNASPPVNYLVDNWESPFTFSSCYPIIQEGYVYSTSHNPTITTGSKWIYCNNGNCPIEFMIFDTRGILSSNQTYYVRAYATSSAGTGYSSELAVVTTTPTGLTTITPSVFTCSYFLSGSADFSDITGWVIRYGICWATTANPTINNSYVEASSGGGHPAFSLYSTYTLVHNTVYHVRSWAENYWGIAYGPDVQFTTAAGSTLTTTSISGITCITANSGGNITSSGASPVISRGVCWNTTGSPTISDNNVFSGTGTGVFTSNLANLLPSTTYHVRAYSTTNCGGGYTTYGNEIDFTTQAAPAETTNSASAINCTTATSGGNVTAAGGGSVTARGVCWKTSSNPTINDSKTSNGSGTGTFTSSLVGLTNNTTYYVRAYATSSCGVTSYGNQISFTTLLGYPTVTTGTISGITKTSATVQGNVSAEGCSSVTARGVCFNTSPSPTINDEHTTNGSGTGSFTGTLSPLTSNTKYYVRAYATNSFGTAYGTEKNFITLP